jgi:predicted RNA-binding Zn-ribbon protein involved in translation (DUF1610 family)
MDAIETIEAPAEAVEVQECNDHCDGFTDIIHKPTCQMYVAPAAPMLVPACPHCGEDPLKLALMTQVFPGGAIGSIMFCATCRKTISVQLVGMQKPSGGK